MRERGMQAGARRHAERVIIYYPTDRRSDCDVIVWAQVRVVYF